MSGQSTVKQLLVQQSRVLGGYAVASPSENSVFFNELKRERDGDLLMAV